MQRLCYTHPESTSIRGDGTITVTDDRFLKAVFVRLDVSRCTVIGKLKGDQFWGFGCPYCPMRSFPQFSDDFRITPVSPPL